jgi:hypothetical protein
MTADRATVAAGKQVRYFITVRNVGHADFSGRSFEIQWHIPLDTEYQYHPTCDGTPLVGLQVALVCAVVFPELTLSLPGDGNASHQTLDSGGLIAIGAGAKWVHEVIVRVDNGIPPGTRIQNHAHLHLYLNGRAHTITTDTVTATVQ